MKTRALPWLLVLVFGSLAPGAQLALPNFTAPPGSSFVLPLTLASQSKSIAGVQFDLQFDSSNFGFTATLGNGAAAAGKSLNLWQLYPGRWRFIIVGLNQTAIGDGTLINLHARASSSAPAGAYPMQILNVVVTDPSAKAIATTESVGSIVVAGNSSPTLKLQSRGVLNGASLRPGEISPSEIVTLFGADLTPGVITFDGVAAQVLYAQPDEIRLVVPAAIRKPSTTIEVRQDGRSILQLQLPVVDAAPAIFAADGSGAGPGAILNSDASRNSPSAPAGKGTAITLFATGTGQMDLPISITIGGVPAEIVHASPAPGLPAGTIMIKCLVPESAPTGWTVPIVLTVGSESSQPGLSVSIR